MVDICKISAYNVKGNIQIRAFEIQGSYSQDFYFLKITNNYGLSRQSWLRDLSEFFFFEN